MVCVFVRACACGVRVRVWCAYERAFVRVCGAFVRACVPACLRACVRTCERVYVKGLLANIRSLLN